MKIVIRRARVLTQKSGVRRAVELKPYKTFPKDYEFGFDILKPIEWKNFLMRLKINDKKLARKTDDGDDVAYKVIATCMDSKERTFFEENGRKVYPSSAGNYYCLFPSYDIELSKQLGKNKELNLGDFGRLVE